MSGPKEIPERLKPGQYLVVYEDGSRHICSATWLYAGDPGVHRYWILAQMPGERDAVEVFKASQVKTHMGSAHFPLKAYRTFPNLDAALAWAALTGEVP